MWLRVRSFNKGEIFMISYQNDDNLKSFVVSEMKKHQEAAYKRYADELIGLLKQEGTL